MRARKPLNEHPVITPLEALAENEENEKDSLTNLSPMQRMLMSKQKEKSGHSMSTSLRTSQAIKLINSFDLYQYTKVDDIFKFWETHDSKPLSKLAKVVLSVLTTQVSLEKLFSGVRYILSELRNGLAEDS